MTRQGPTLDEFEATLLANHSATRALTEWCALHDIGDPARIRAITLRDGADDLHPEARELLSVDAQETLGYRHVRLVCGDKVLSEAHNWFVRSRLTPDMNRTLETGDTPFGTVASALAFTRTRIATSRGPFHECPADTVLSQRALLRLPDGRPLAVLVECYSAANLVPARKD